MFAFQSSASFTTPKDLIDSNDITTLSDLIYAIKAAKNAGEVSFAFYRASQLSQATLACFLSADYLVGNKAARLHVSVA